MFTPRILRAALAAALPVPLPDFDPATDTADGSQATARIAFVNGRLCQWHASTTGGAGEWREVPSVTVEDEPAPNAGGEIAP